MEAIEARLRKGQVVACECTYLLYHYYHMGWFSTSTQPDVSRQDRKQCWDSRDVYFACLDRSGVLEAGKEGNAACAKEKSNYEANCAKSWASRTFFFFFFCATLYLACSRLNISTNAEYWPSSKKIYWCSPSCRLRQPNKNDVVLR